MARIITVASLADPRLAPYRNLRDVTLSARHGRFVAEGDLVVRALVRSAPALVESLLFLEGRLPGLREVVDGIGASVPVYTARQDVLDAVVGFHLHRGCLALGRRPAKRAAETLVANLGAGPRRVLVLEGLTNHDNVGGVFRDAAALDADAVLLDERTCDPLYRKAIRVSIGAVFAVPFASVPTAAEAAAALARAGFAVLALTPSAPDVDLDRLEVAALPDRIALLLGTEGAGLSSAALAAAHRRVRIPLTQGADSLNVAVAAAVALYALRPKSVLGQS